MKVLPELAYLTGSEGFPERSEDILLVLCSVGCVPDPEGSVPVHILTPQHAGTSAGHPVGVERLQHQQLGGGPGGRVHQAGDRGRDPVQCRRGTHLHTTE